LSGVARASGRFGKGIVAQMLCGSKSAKLTKWKLDRLSTYGLLNYLTQTEVSQLLDVLMERRLVEQIDVDRHRPVLQLTDYGSQVMKSNAPLKGPLPLPGDLLAKLRRSLGEDDQQGDPGSGHESDLAAPDPGLLEALRHWRRDTADRLQSPAYTVLHTTSLELIARAKPTSPDELERIKGIGPAKLEQYGETILQLVARHASASQPADAGNGSSGRLHPLEALPIEERPTFYWTWRVLHGGATLAECALIRGMSPAEVLEDAGRACDAGLPLDTCEELSVRLPVP
jgi:ATP-dependent DNA helicase RecQ